LRSPFDYREGDENQPFPQTSKNNQHVVMLMTGENMKTSSLGCEEEEVVEVSPYP
jgi:hypothetical protein